MQGSISKVIFVGKRTALLPSINAESYSYLNFSEVNIVFFLQKILDVLECYPREMRKGVFDIIEQKSF